MGSRRRARLVRASLWRALLILHILAMAHLCAVSYSPHPHLAGVGIALELRWTMGLTLARPLSLGLLFYRVDRFLGVVDARVQGP